jgi:ribosome-associated protein
MATPDRRHRLRQNEGEPPSDAATDAAPPSKTRRKAEMHDLLALGVALVELEPRRFEALAVEAALPERLVDAIVAARSITAWGGRKRQLQYVGKLMREVDPAPIRHRLDEWAQGRNEDAAPLHAREKLRDSLLADPAALGALVARHPGADRAKLAALIARARAERERGDPPHAYRELFRTLKTLIDPAAGGTQSVD